MIAKVFLLGLLVAASCASPLTSTVNYADAVKTYLEAFQKMAPCGYAAENIPVLEPLIDAFTAFNYTRGETSIVGNASNIRISGLSNIVILKGEYDPNTLRASFDILFQEIQILGSTIMEGVFNMLGFTFPMRQNTLLNERLQQLRIVGEYTFAQSLSNSNGLRMIDLKLQFYVADVKIDNWDTLLNISTNNYLESITRETLLALVKEIQPRVNQLIAKYVLPDVNDLLSAVNLTQLTNYFVNTANNWNSANCNVMA
ncbi:uncharacterized protein LOC115771713 [Drosophila novamexicana]|uniref:uncharacterized protein LOC115771713 n=1 Tax=Drosophila novamexicana TaxID=47314 RepID=UPI0011E5C94F|nr:uncharacterized protein LOC115771713 [Drosophila novamexicana]